MSRERDDAPAYVMVFDRHGPAVPRDPATGLPLPPRDGRNGAWIACADCAAREPCGSSCPRYRPFRGG